MAKRPQDRFASAGAVRRGAACRRPPNPLRRPLQGRQDDAHRGALPSRSRRVNRSRLRKSLQPSLPRRAVAAPRLRALLGSSSACVAGRRAAGSSPALSRRRPTAARRDPRRPRSPRPTPRRRTQPTVVQPAPPKPATRRTRSQDRRARVLVRWHHHPANPAPNRAAAETTDKPAIPPDRTSCRPAPARLSRGAPAMPARTVAPSDQPPAHQDAPTATPPPPSRRRSWRPPRRCCNQDCLALHGLRVRRCHVAGSRQAVAERVADTGSARRCCNSSASARHAADRLGHQTPSTAFSAPRSPCCSPASVPPPGAPRPGLGLTLKDNKTVLQEDESILPRITMPDFAGELRVDYLAHDGTMVAPLSDRGRPEGHSAGEPARRLAAGERLALGDDPGSRIGSGIRRSAPT